MWGLWVSIGMEKVLIFLMFMGFVNGDVNSNSASMKRERERIVEHFMVQYKSFSGLDTKLMQDKRLN
jgi:hypothetical protein